MTLKKSTRLLGESVKKNDIIIAKRIIISFSKAIGISSFTAAHKS